MCGKSQNILQGAKKNFNIKGLPFHTVSFILKWYLFQPLPPPRGVVISAVLYHLNGDKKEIFCRTLEIVMKIRSLIIEKKLTYYKNLYGPVHYTVNGRHVEWNQKDIQSVGISKKKNVYGIQHRSTYMFWDKTNYFLKYKKISKLLNKRLFLVNFLQ